MAFGEHQLAELAAMREADDDDYLGGLYGGIAQSLKDLVHENHEAPLGIEGTAR